MKVEKKEPQKGGSYIYKQNISYEYIINPITIQKNQYLQQTWYQFTNELFK